MNISPDIASPTVPTIKSPLYVRYKLGIRITHATILAISQSNIDLVVDWDRPYHRLCPDHFVVSVIGELGQNLLPILTWDARSDKHLINIPVNLLFSRQCCHFDVPLVKSCELCLCL